MRTSKLRYDRPKWLVFSFVALIGLASSMSVQANDSDQDGMPDVWEIEWGITDPYVFDHYSDADLDGLVAYDEYVNGTSPINHDTDFDGLDDTEGYDYYTSPTDPDSDDDGMADGFEITYFALAWALTPNGDDDIDGDDASNYCEYMMATNPNVNEYADATSELSIQWISAPQRDGFNVWFEWVVPTVPYDRLEIRKGHCWNSPLGTMSVSNNIITLTNELTPNDPYWYMPYTFQARLCSGNSYGPWKNCQD